MRPGAGGGLDVLAADGAFGKGICLGGCTVGVFGMGAVFGATGAGSGAGGGGKRFAAFWATLFAV
jgi:hypothetical protein